MYDVRQANYHYYVSPPRPALPMFQHAKSLMSAAENRGGSTFKFQDLQKKIYRGLEEAEKDNNFIYHAKVPELNNIATIGKAAVAKSLPLSQPMSPNFKGGWRETNLRAREHSVLVHSLTFITRSSSDFRLSEPLIRVQ